MVTVIYQVGDCKYEKSFDFNYAITPETFDKAFTDVAYAFKSANESANVTTALEPKVVDTKTTTAEVGIAPKKAKLAPVKVETF